MKSHNLFHLLTFKIAEDSLLVDLQRFLVPTTTKLINAISQVEPMVLERTRSPVLMELARASLDFMLSTDPRTSKLQLFAWFVLNVDREVLFIKVSLLSAIRWIFFHPAKFDNFKDEKISDYKTLSVAQSKNLQDWKLLV